MEVKGGVSVGGGGGGGGWLVLVEDGSTAHLLQESGLGGDLQCI